jgi:predicted ribosome quality control (RQC) complex YloA/Tae2 family protein
MARRGQESDEPPDEAEIDRLARRFTSPDGFEVLVGRTAEANDRLTLRVARPRDFWLHVAGVAGSHVVVRNPNNLDRLPRATLRFAAGLAARYSKASAGGRVAVHVARRSEVSKPRGWAAGKVALGRYETVMEAPLELEE